MSKYLILVGLAAVFLTSSIGVHAQDQDGTRVTVTGLVYKEPFYEEINYGESPETDSIALVCMLKVDSASAQDIKNIGKVNILHLVIPDTLKTRCSSLEGLRVETTGIVESRSTGHHHGDAIMQVEQFKILRAGGQLAENIKGIRDKFIAINKNTKSYKLIEKNVLGMSLEGGLLKAYFANGELKKATITLFGEAGRESYDLYYNASDLIFVLNTSYRYSQPFGKVVSKDENRYYFQSGKMIKWINEKGNDVLITDKEAVERESNMIDLSKLVINISKIQFNCVEVSSDTEYKKCEEDNTKHQ